MAEGVVELFPVGPDAVGGAEQVLSALDRALVAAGHRSLVVAWRGSEVAGELLRQGAGTVVAGPTAIGAPGKRAPYPAVPPGALGDGDDAQ